MPWFPLLAREPGAPAPTGKEEFLKFSLGLFSAEFHGLFQRKHSALGDLVVVLCFFLGGGRGRELLKCFHLYVYL